jgi:hypothetical protein
MVNIVSQASDERISLRNRGNFNQGNSTPGDQVSQERDVELKRRQAGISRGLTHRQQGANLSEKIIPDPGPRSSVGPV